MTAVAVMTALLASAGPLAAGSSAASGGSTAPSSFVQDADIECAAAHAQLQQLPTKLTPTSIGQGLKILASLVKQLGALSPPKADAKQFHLVVAERAKEVIDDIYELRALAKGDHTAVTQWAHASQSAAAASASWAKALGLTSCE